MKRLILSAILTTHVGPSYPQLVGSTNTRAGSLVELEPPKEVPFGPSPASRALPKR
jgi:hypothetical protein